MCGQAWIGPDYCTCGAAVGFFLFALSVSLSTGGQSIASQVGYKEGRKPTFFFWSSSRGLIPFEQQWTYFLLTINTPLPPTTNLNSFFVVLLDQKSCMHILEFCLGIRPIFWGHCPIFSAGVLASVIVKLRNWLVDRTIFCPCFHIFKVDLW